MRVLDPELVKVIEQLPVCEAESVPVHDCPVLAVTVTDPVGPAPAPDAEKLIVTACCRVDGFGVCAVIEVLLPILVAKVPSVSSAD